jgi:hypothetical protein
MPGEAQATDWLAVGGQVAASAEPSLSASSPASTQVLLGLSTVKKPWVGAMNDGHWAQPGGIVTLCTVKVTSLE